MDDAARKARKGPSGVTWFPPQKCRFGVLWQRLLDEEWMRRCFRMGISRWELRNARVFSDLDEVLHWLDAAV